MKKVTILTPVYNGEKYVEKYLESVINQTYKNIELIIVDDGSKDNTKSIIDKYVKISKNGINIRYIYQENAGQAAAFAKAIKFVDGEYLAWADSDDYYEEDAIEKMVEYMEKNKDCTLLRCNAVARLENENERIIEKMFVQGEYQNKTDIFEDLIYIRGINIFVGVYMIRFSEYKKNNPDLYIYPGREGQNWQLLLPAAYNNKCGYLDKVVYNYTVRENSHSHIERTPEDYKKRLDGKRNIIIETLKILNVENVYLESVNEKILQNHLHEIYFIYVRQFKKNEVKDTYSKLKNKNFKICVYYLIGTNKLVHNIYRWISKIKSEVIKTNG